MRCGRETPRRLSRRHLASRHIAKAPSTSTIATHARKKKCARLAVSRLRWSHLGANFIYLGAHDGDTTSALPKAIQKYTSKTLSPVALQAEQESTQQPHKNSSNTLSPAALQARRNENSSKIAPPKRSPQRPCSPTIAARVRSKKYPPSAKLFA